MIPDFFASEALIQARIAESLDMPQLTVLTMADLGKVRNLAQIAPAVHVVYDGYSVKDSGVAGWVDITQTWLTVAVVRNMKDVHGGSGARADGGAILDALIGALANWKPSPELAPLKLVNAPGADYQDAVGIFPLAWQTHYRRKLSCESN